MKTMFFPDLPSNYYLYKWGDLHCGNPAIDIKAINKFIKTVLQHKHAYVTLSGDLCEYIYPSDKRFQLQYHKKRMDEELTYFKELFQKLKDRDKVLYLISGNHEMRFQNMISPVKLLGEWFDCEYATGNMAKIIFPEFRICDWHPIKGTLRSYAHDIANREFNELLILKKKLKNLPADDCLIMSCGHFHKVRILKPTGNYRPRMLTIPDKVMLGSFYTQPTKIWINKTKNIFYIHEDDRYYICTGSALRGYVEGLSTYSEQLGLPPTEIGCIKIQVQKDNVKEVTKVLL